MKYRFFVLIGIVTLALVAAGLTEASMLIGRGGGQIADDVLHRPGASTTPAVSASPRATPRPTPDAQPSAAPSSSVMTPTPASTPQPTATARPAGTAVTTSFVRLRAGASTDTAVVAELAGGSVVTLGSYRDAAWQQVTYNGQLGYVYRAYLAY